MFCAFYKAQISAGFQQALEILEDLENNLNAWNNYEIRKSLKQIMKLLAHLSQRLTGELIGYP